MLVLVVHLFLSAGLVLLGRWGRRHAPSLVWAGLPQRERLRRARVFRRGGGVCYGVAAALVLAGLWGVAT